MATDTQTDTATEEATAPAAAPSHPMPDPLSSLRMVKWFTRLLVYPGVTLLIPLDHFLSGLTWDQAFSVHLGGYLIATLAIEGAFAQAFKLRRHAAFPNAMVMELGAAQTLDAAATHALTVVHHLLRVRASFLAVDAGEGRLAPASLSGVSRDRAVCLLEAGAASVEEALRTGEPVPFRPPDFPTPERALKGDERLVFVPVTALRNPIGVLAVVAGRRNRLAKDGDLLRGMGSAIGLSLENLRQQKDLRESNARLRVMVEQMPAVLWTTDARLRFTSSLGAALAALGLEPNQAAGMTLFEYFQTEDPEFLPIAAHRRALTGESATYEVEWAGRAFHCHVEPLRDARGKPSGTIGVALDITDHKRAEAATAGQKEVLETIARGAPLPQVLDSVCRIIERQSPGALCSILLLDEDGTTLRLGAAPSLPPDYAKALDGIAIGDGAGACGTAAFLGEQVIAADIAADSRWSGMREMALEHGIRACWSTPLFSESGRVLGTFAIAHREPREPDERDQQAIKLATYLAGIATERRRAEEELRRREQEFKALAENAPDVIARFDRELRYVYANPAIERALGFPPEEVIGKTHSEVGISPQLYEIWHASLRAVFETGREGSIEFTSSSGSHYYQSRLVPEPGPDDSIETVLTITRDITEHKRGEEALRESEAKFRTLAETVAAAAFIYQGTRMRYVNPAAEAVTGYSRDELLQMDFWDVIHPDFRELVRERGLARQQGESIPSRYEVKIVTKGGAERWVDFMAGMIEYEGAPAVLGTAFDITERKDAEETVRHLAYHDALTGLPNRTLFKDRLDVALAQARRNGRSLAVMFLDLDRFKMINDTVGHATGDRLLQSVAERLRRLVRDGDTVARVGGDEFTLLLPEIDVQQATEVAQRILASLREPWLFDGRQFHITTSIGVAMYGSDAAGDAESLLRDADAAMYRAKDHGRDNYQLFTPTMNARITQHLALETDLRRALKRDELTMYYQPQLDVRSGRIVGVEALIRWQHPERGLVPPAEFIPFAEELGLILPIGEWVIRRVCEQARAWQKAGLPDLRLAVNISARRFHQPDVAEGFSRMLDEVGISPDRLQLEITEGVVMENLDFTTEVLRALRAMGVTIAIDDFGTGYSSLAYLKRLPIDAVKIDQSFVRDIGSDANDAAIVSTVIEMAHSLKLKVVAEGVETEEQLAFLKGHGCDEMQGFLFSRPLPPEALEAALRRNDGRGPHRALPVDAPSAP